MNILGAIDPIQTETGPNSMCIAEIFYVQI